MPGWSSVHRTGAPPWLQSCEAWREEGAECDHIPSPPRGCRWASRPWRCWSRPRSAVCPRRNGWAGRWAAGTARCSSCSVRSDFSPLRKRCPSTVETMCIMDAHSGAHQHFLTTTLTSSNATQSYYVHKVFKTIIPAYQHIVRGDGCLKRKDQ